MLTRSPGNSCTLKFENLCCGGKDRLCSLQQADKCWISWAHLRSGVACVYERILLHGQPIWFHWFFLGRSFFFIHWFLLQHESSSSVLCRLISIHFDSFPHQLGISPLAPGSANNCACLQVTSYGTTVENCKRSRGYCLYKSREAWMPSGKPGNLSQGQAWGPEGSVLFAEKQVTKWAHLWQCFGHSWKILC